MALMRLKGVPPDAFLVQACSNDYCKALTLHGPISRLTWAWAEGVEGRRIRPLVKCRKCDDAYMETFELEPIGG